MKKILIISSEPLHPLDTFSSCFELSQAQALLELGHQVAIISVTSLSSLDLFKAMIRKLTGGSKTNLVSQRFTFQQLLTYFFSSLWEREAVEEYVIEGVSVFEGFCLTVKGPAKYEQSAERWRLAGSKAFDEYRAKFGPPTLVHAHSRLLVAAHIALGLKEVHGLPYVITEHSSAFLRNQLADEAVPLLIKAYKEATGLAAVSESLAQRVRELLGCKRSFAIIPNPLNQLFMSNLPTAKNGDEVVFLSLGRMDENKGQMLLLLAFAEVKESNWKLVFAGDGPERNSLEQNSLELGLESYVHFAGHQTPAEVLEHLLRSSVLVISSAVETFGVVAIEAGACGLPVLTTRCGGPEDIIDEQNGILVSRTQAALEQGLVLIAQQHDSFDRNLIRKRSLARYSPAVVAQSLDSFYDQALGALG